MVVSSLEISTRERAIEGRGTSTSNSDRERGAGFDIKNEALTLSTPLKLWMKYSSSGLNILLLAVSCSCGETGPSFDFKSVSALRGDGGVAVGRELRGIVELIEAEDTGFLVNMREGLCSNDTPFDCRTEDVWLMLGTGM